MKKEIVLTQKRRGCGPIPRPLNVVIWYTAGQVALNPETGQMVEGGIEEQTHQVFANLKAVLEATVQALKTL